MADELSAEITTPDWQAIAEDLAAALRCAARIGGWYRKDPQAALALYEAALAEVDHG